MRFSLFRDYFFAVYLAMKEAPRRKIIPDDILDFILIAFPLAIIGARVLLCHF